MFLHGLGLSGAMWQPQFQCLPDYYCLAPDLPEHGNSANIGPFSLKDASRRMADVIRQSTSTGCAHVVGLSMGGAVAMRMLFLLLLAVSVSSQPFRRFNSVRHAIFVQSMDDNQDCQEG